jgi:hypothetical protein
MKEKHELKSNDTIKLFLNSQNFVVTLGNNPFVVRSRCGIRHGGRLAVTLCVKRRREKKNRKIVMWLRGVAGHFQSEHFILSALRKWMLTQWSPM